MKLLLALLGIADMIAGITIIFPQFFPPQQIMFVIFYCVSKGILSILSSAGVGYMWDWMGWLDLTNGIILFLVRLGMFRTYLLLFHIALILKGLYSLVRSF